MAIERIVDTSARDDDSDEQVIEVTLRPQRFDEYTGQERIKKNLKLAIEAAKYSYYPIFCYRNLGQRREYKLMQPAALARR